MEENQKYADCFAQFNKQENAGWDPVKVDSISIGLDFVGQEDGWVKSQIKPMVNVRN